MIEELLAQLEKAKMGAPEHSVESAVMIVIAAKAEAEKFERIVAQAKELITEVMTETGKLSYRTKAGDASVASGSMMVRYDTDALDHLCASMPDLAAVLQPHRKVTERAGTLRVTGKR